MKNLYVLNYKELLGNNEIIKKCKLIQDNNGVYQFPHRDSANIFVIEFYLVYICGSYPHHDGLLPCFANNVLKEETLIKEIIANTSESLISSYVKEQMIISPYNGKSIGEMMSIQSGQYRSGNYLSTLYAAYFWFKSIDLVKEIDVIGLLQQQQIKINPNDGAKLPNGFS